MIKSEHGLIRSVRDLISGRQKIPHNIKGTGDDCAVYRIAYGRYGLFSTDMSVEDAHFNFSWCTHYDAGYRSMTANISDIFAMGGRALMAFVSIGLPAGMEEDEVLQAYHGMIDCANRHGVAIAGGDTVSSHKLVLAISIYGETGNPVMRNGAKPGDYIYVTGNTGMSLLGYELFRSGADGSVYPESAVKHLRPEPCACVEHVLSKYSPTAMIDISDGMLSDMERLCEESSCGFELYAENIPIPREVASYCESSSKDPLDYSLRSGEEYELILTSKKEIRNDNRVSLIGKIIPEGKYIITGSNRIPADTAGFDHFKKEV